ncbi:MAG: hypothetical protein KAU90_12825, partial [Sulfurovaceae bacterium]|nr:hypothetical protein [Sulfurovaceae bacterium]
KSGAENIAWNFASDASYYSIYVVIDTKKGSRYMIYTPLDNDRGISDSGDRILFGLGKDTGIKGKGGEYFVSRNIKEDLKKYEPDNEFIDFNRFIVRGSGDLETLTTFKAGGFK